MSTPKAVFLKAVPYADDALSLPVAEAAAASAYYERVFGFRVVRRETTPHPKVVLARDAIEIGVAENGGDATQEGCVFVVDDVGAAHNELAGTGAKPGPIGDQKFDDRPHRGFFIIAPDGLCYMIVQPLG